MGQWVKRAELRGPAGYNATGAAEDDAAIAAFATEGSGPTATGSALRNRFTVMAKPPTGVVATDTANLLAAVAALPAPGSTVGGTIRLHRGKYLVNQPLPLIAGIAYVGAGKAATEIQVTTGNLFAPTTSIQHPIFEKLILSTAGGHLFEFGATGGMHESVFRDVVMITYANAASLMHLDGSGDFLENVFENCEFNRQTTATVPAFDFKGPAGGLNANTWRNSRAHGHNCASTPFWRMEATLASLLHDNVWENIVGEQNRGGLVHLFSPGGVKIENVVDWDATGNYVDHIIKVDKSATSGGAQPRDVVARNSGTRFGTLNAGIAHFFMPTTLTPSGVTLENIGDANGASVITVPPTGRTVVGNRAARSIRAVTASYSVDPKTDSVIVCNGAAVNVTLPNPSAVLPGTSIRVVNLNAALCGILGGGGSSVNGAGSQTQAQYVSKEWITDGSLWFG